MFSVSGGDEQPGIRTNATICLGKIACYIDPSQRQRILINAFTRAFKDPFSPARIAAVVGLIATQQYYSLVEIANRILPALSPMTIDPDSMVRKQSFAALHGFIEKLEKASENPESIPELEAQVNAGGKSGLLSSDKVPRWAAWAVQSISGRFYKSPTPTQNPAVTENKEQTSENESAPEARPKSHESASKKHGDDGWGSLDDSTLSAESDEKWEDADDTVPKAKKTTDGWDDEWEGITATETKKSSVASLVDSKKSVPKKGGLKLKNAIKKPADEDDLDYALGIKQEPNLAANKLGTDGNSDKFAVNQNTVSSSWECDISSSGWDDFVTDSGLYRIMLFFFFVLSTHSFTNLSGLLQCLYHSAQ
ncbi:unnamed protein product [Gongylonema pulchrum]|uniref:Uncharacterized protein n=1 Tax=Gongylonema pulchrum TaxID=637853 RepID=A0A3P6QUE5_9BILA|nr:unnamed protein product [Gongylonema pulchrum]